MHDNTYKKVLIRLKSCRIIFGFKSARYFANTFSIPEKTYAQHEAGTRKIPMESLTEYADYLKIDPCWLLTGEGFPSESDEMNDIICKYLFSNHNIKLILPKLYADKKCQIDGKLLTNILSTLINIVSIHNIKIDCHDLVEFIYSIYNSTIDINADEQTKNNLIDLATKSLLTATQAVQCDIKPVKSSKHKGKSSWDY